NGNAQLVSSGRIECAELLRTFDDFSRAARQFPGRELRDCHLSLGDNERIARSEPRAARKPKRGLERQLAIALALDCCLRLRARSFAALPEVVFERYDFARLGLLIFERLHALAQQDIQVARRAKLLGEPFQFALDRFGVGLREQRLEEGYRGAQAPEADS